jgi:hypothetical protein
MVHALAATARLIDRSLDGFQIAATVGLPRLAEHPANVPIAVFALQPK